MEQYHGKVQTDTDTKTVSFYSKEQLPVTLQRTLLRSKSSSSRTDFLLVGKRDTGRSYTSIYPQKTRHLFRRTGGKVDRPIYRTHSLGFGSQKTYFSLRTRTASGSTDRSVLRQIPLSVPQNLHGSSVLYCHSSRCLFFLFDRRPVSFQQSCECLYGYRTACLSDRFVILP